MTNKDILVTEGIRYVEVHYPKQYKEYEFFSGREKQTKKNWFGVTRVVCYELPEGWVRENSYPQSVNEIIEEYELERKRLFVSEGGLWKKGRIHIKYKNSADYDFYSSSETKIKYLENEILSKLGKNIVFKKD